MKALKIQIGEQAGVTKQQQLINELVRIIQTELSEGDLLPSVNAVSHQLNISRDTVFKAYQELKNRGIVNAMPNKGYYVNRDIKKVLILLDYYSPHKEIVFREIQKCLDSSYSVDLIFHHYNSRLFDSIISESVGRYNYHIIMNIDTQQFKLAGSLKKLNPARTLFLDIPVLDLPDDTYNFVFQDFEGAVYCQLVHLYDRIRRYNVFNLVNPVLLRHPVGTENAFSKFCKEYDLNGNIISSQELNVNSDEAYFVLRQPDLYQVLDKSRRRKFTIGKDVGVLVYNDAPLYEFVACGITAISTDFKMMGEQAGKFVSENRIIREFIPTQHIIRKSL